MIPMQATTGPDHRVSSFLGGVLLPASWILRFVFDISRPYTGTVEFVASILLVFGFMGLYGCQHVQSGVLGFLGFVLLWRSADSKIGKPRGWQRFWSLSLGRPCYLALSCLELARGK